MVNIKKALVSAGVFAALMGLLTTAAFADGQVGVIGADNLNIRESAGTTAAVVAQLAKGSQVSVLESYEGWYKISTGNVTGWVSGMYLAVSFGTVQGKITAEDVNVRTGPGTSYDVIVAVNQEDVDVIDASGDWYKVRFSSGVEGWVNSDFVNTGSTVISRGASLGTQITDYAKRFLGVRYVWGGSSSRGVDCSGFTSLVFRNFGIDLNRVAADQAGQGARISTSSLRPGDLVFFDTNGGKNYINHVGIYLGDGEFIHASSGKGSVIVSSLWDGFYSNAFMTARTLTR